MIGEQIATQMHDFVFYISRKLYGLVNFIELTVELFGKKRRKYSDSEDSK